VAFVWKREAVIAAGIKGRRKAAMTAYAASQRPITLARVAWLDRPIIPIKDKRETLGADFDKQPERKTMMRESIETACSWTRSGLISLASTLANFPDLDPGFAGKIHHVCRAMLTGTGNEQRGFVVS
jgi:hypothetical protein